MVGRFVKEKNIRCNLLLLLLRLKMKTVHVSRCAHHTSHVLANVRTLSNATNYNKQLTKTALANLNFICHPPLNSPIVPIIISSVNFN